MHIDLPANERSHPVEFCVIALINYWLVRGSASDDCKTNGGDAKRAAVDQASARLFRIDQGLQVALSSSAKIGIHHTNGLCCIESERLGETEVG